MRVIYLSFLFLLPLSQLNSQELFGLHSIWDRTFGEWVIETDEENVEGELYLRWPGQGNWTEWDYRIDDASGEIKQQWRNNPNVWVLRGDGETVNMRTVWRNDFTQWKLDDGTTEITLVARYTSLDDWYIRGSQNFKLYTSYEGDPRDWELYEDLELELSMEMRMAILFLAMYHAIPKI